MSLTPRLDLKQTQTLAMTPKLQQAIRLLQMSALELNEAVAEELEQNPFLEKESDDSRETDAESFSPDGETDGRKEEDSFLDSANEEGDAPLDMVAGDEEDSFYERSDYSEDNDFSSSFSDPWEGGSAADDDFSAVDLCRAAPVSAEESLLRQINAAFSNPQDRAVATGMLEKLNDCGWLTEPLDAQEEKLLPVLQTFSPTGVFAVSLADCLALQLKELNRYDPLIAVVLEHLDLLGKKEYAKLAKLCGTDEEDVFDMAEEIRRLNPRPLSDLRETAAPVVVPDVLLCRKKDGTFVVRLNRAALPRVLINREYSAEVASFAKTDKATQRFVREKLSSAAWLVKALNQRAETILKVATEIVRRQRDFFLKGESAMKPMVLKDVADAVGLHESTVSRVTVQKYIAAPSGVFELRHFFSQGVAGNAGEIVSGQAVRARIKALVDAEKPDDVLSDDALVVLLKREGIEIARRTVAKYRESVGIPTSAQRKRDKRLNLKRK